MEEETNADGTGDSGAGQQIKLNEQKWGKELWSSWVGIPSVLIRHQSAFGISSTQMNVLLYLIDRWGWKSVDDLPFPSAKTVAKAIGLNERTIRKALSDMVTHGLIECHERCREDGGRTSNSYSFNGLKKKALAVRSILKKKASQLDADKHSQARQKAQLRVTGQELRDHVNNGGA